MPLTAQAVLFAPLPPQVDTWPGTKLASCQNGMGAPPVSGEGREEGRVWGLQFPICFLDVTSPWEMGKRWGACRHSPSQDLHSQGSGTRHLLFGEKGQDRLEAVSASAL